MQVQGYTAAAFAPVAVQATDARMSALVLSDRLLTLAQEAERAGLMDSADLLVRLAHDVFDEEAETASHDGWTETAA